MTSVIAELLQRACVECDFRIRLLEPEFVKEQVAERMEVPSDWSQRNIVFDTFVDVLLEPMDPNSPPETLDAGKKLLLIDMTKPGKPGQVATFRCRRPPTTTKTGVIWV